MYVHHNRKPVCIAFPELVQSPRCIQIGEEDIEDLSFILTLKGVGKSAEHVYQGISNCYLLWFFDNG
jgi:hypothetical protein